MEPQISEFSKFGRISKMAAADRKLDLDHWGPPFCCVRDVMSFRVNRPFLCTTSSVFV